ncbi:hypothetical protein SR70_16730 [Klebsiella aerogenes]|nr:hypothetical protein SR70_16730 [Klebsiella aerogenes]KUR23295.1 hypothetical protein AWI37_21320 [Klebsiella aerogenes]
MSGKEKITTDDFLFFYSFQLHLLMAYGLCLLASVAIFCSFFQQMALFLPLPFAVGYCDSRQTNMIRTGIWCR